LHKVTYAWLTKWLNIYDVHSIDKEVKINKEHSETS
jgi:hypothetical protein